MAAAPYGGPIGTNTLPHALCSTDTGHHIRVRLIANSDHKVLMSSALLREPVRRSPSSRPQLEIYSASGVSIASFPVKIHTPFNQSRRSLGAKLFIMIL